MKEIAIASSWNITDEELRAFVVNELKGEWPFHDGLQTGTVEDGEAYVLISVEPVDDLEPEEVEELRERLGGPVECLVAIRVGRAPGSAELSASVVQRIREKWGGVVFV